MPDGSRGVDVSVVVVNWHRPDLTAEAIASIDADRADLAVEVVLVENGAVPGATDALVERFPWLRVVPVIGNSGFAGGANHGLRVARGEIVVLLNNDAVARPGFLRAGVDRLRSSERDVVAVAARVLLSGRFSPVTKREGALLDYSGVHWSRVPDEADGSRLTNSTGVELSRYGNGFDRDWLAEQDASSGPAEDPFAFSGSAAFLRRDVVEALGGFDERLFMYYEDLELSWRMRLAGYRIVYEHRAVAVHQVAQSSMQRPTLGRRLSMRNRLLTILRNGSRRFILRVVLRTAVRFGADVVDMIRSRSTAGSSGLALGDWARVWFRIAQHAPSIVVSRMRETSAHRRIVVEREFVGRI
ncbi:glycosyltransferase family 2 protein [Microbacteriaceae bacterium VKM Ac-2855]|nr:glycosyltransferase family 2 protein [Microbacteriaceae bacterium VKM Ac-2855]